MTDPTTITIAHGDGIGPEIMDAVTRIVTASQAAVAFEPITIGESVYRQGIKSGISDEAWTSLRKNKVLLKAPITTPQGGGYKSLNVTIRKTLGLSANVRPCKSLAPYVATRHPEIDVVIIRENEEDLYAGIEYRQTDQSTESLKVITRPGSERIIRYAFEYARVYGRKKVSCFSKDNIMKITDGLFHKIFDEIGKEYPDIEQEHYIIDIASALVADKPEKFDVIVTLNLYGDIISDIAAEITGSVGLGGSANVGEHFAMFEAIHGSAPSIAGQNIANPSGLLQAAVMMLVHLNQPDKASLIQNAWLRTIEDGIHTVDVYDHETSVQKVGTAEFADAVIDRLGQTPRALQQVAFNVIPQGGFFPARPERVPATKKLMGVDVFLDWNNGDADELGTKLQSLCSDGLELRMIGNRGVKVWPGGAPEILCGDYWRCRFESAEPIAKTAIIELLSRINAAGLDFVKTEQLCSFDGERGYSLAQGE